MSWAIGYDDHWKRDIGYGVPAYCDHPGCREEINRGLSYVCGSEPYGGEHGCGLYFCRMHRQFHEFRDGCCPEVCSRCHRYKLPFKATPEHPRWVDWKLADGSWQEWRDANPQQVDRMRAERRTTEPR